MILYANSTNPLEHTPVVPLDSLTVSITDADGAAVTFADTPAESEGVWSLTLTSTEMADASGTWRIEWVGTAGSQVFTDVEYADVVAGDAEGVFLADLKSELGIEGNGDDAKLHRYLSQAIAALERHYTFPTSPKVTEARTFFADGRLLMLYDPCTVTAVTDEDAGALTYTQPSTDKLRLESPYTGYVTITGSWGYDEYPAEVRRAVAVTAATYYRRANFGADDAPYRGGGAAIPTEAHNLMARVV